MHLLKLFPSNTKSSMKSLLVQSFFCVYVLLFADESLLSGDLHVAAQFLSNMAEHRLCVAVAMATALSCCFQERPRGAERLLRADEVGCTVCGYMFVCRRA